MNQKLHIATARPIGEKCLKYALSNMPEGFELCDDMRESDIVICVMYDKILSKDLLENKRCYNFHAGLLPNYRGVGIFTWVILNGEKETGITLHEMDEGLDTGPVIAFSRFGVDENSTSYSLYNQGMDSLFDLFKEYFHKLLTRDYTTQSFNKKPNSLYTREMLNKVRDLSKLARATYFPGKEGLYFWNTKGAKTIISYD